MQALPAVPEEGELVFYTHNDKPRIRAICHSDEPPSAAEKQGRLDHQAESAERITRGLAGRSAGTLGTWAEPREGKQVYTGHTWRQRDGRAQRVVFQVVQRTIAANGQRLLVPEVEIDTWWTSLGLYTASAEEVIELYHQHGTSEQFHSEKTEMDLERPPSGKFATNALLLALGQVAYNVLQLCDQVALAEDRPLPPQEKMPLSKPVTRRRLRSVMQDLMYLAARPTCHAGRLGLKLWCDNPWRFAWQRLYHRFTEAAVVGLGRSS